MSENFITYDPEKGRENPTSTTKQGDFASSMPAYASEGEIFEFEEKRDLKRGLSQRHIQMIALAGTIGTGLFLGSGRAIAYGGPLGAFMGYIFVGILCVGVVSSIAELSALVPLSGSIIRHAHYFVDPALSFAQGYNSVYSTMISLPAELTATAVIVEFWSTISPAVWITVFGILVVISNLLFVRVYGEMEFSFATLKIMLIIGLNIMALVIVCGGGPNHETYGFRYWRNPGPFTDFLGYTGSLGHFMGFWTTFSNAVYAYSGIDGFAVAAAETRNPRHNIPIAAKRIFWRISIFYVLSIFMVGLLVSSSDPNLLKTTGTAAQSPFVIAATNAGIKTVPSIINSVVLTSAWSAGNSVLLMGSRVLYGLAMEGHAPKIFTRTSRMGVPYVCVGFLGLFICLGYMAISDSAAKVFGWLQDLVAVGTLVGWMVICTVYLRFYYGCKAQGIDRSELPWHSIFQPYAAWLSLISFSIILFFGGYTVFIHGFWDTEVFVASYINVPIFALLYFGYKVVNKTRIIPLKELPIRHFIDIANANPEEKPKPKTGWHRFNFFWE